MRRLAIPLLLTALLGSGITASASDKSDWYQVEVIIFKQLSPTITDETWPLPDQSYPAGMISIGAEQGDDIAPHRLTQLIQLVEDSALAESGETVEVDSGFLFEDRASRRPRNRGDAFWGTEPLVDDETAVDGEPVEATLDEDALAGLFAEADQDAFRTLPAGMHELDGVARSLRFSKGYRILKHVAWAQPINREKTHILLQAGERFDDWFEVDGVISLSRSRFLHVATDLWFRQFEQGPSAVTAGPDEMPAIPPAVSRQYADLVAAATEGAAYQPVFAAPLRHSRRMRSATMHYIDHPFFGVILKIGRYTPPQEVTAR